MKNIDCRGEREGCYYVLSYKYDTLYTHVPAANPLNSRACHPRQVVEAAGLLLRIQNTAEGHGPEAAVYRVRERESIRCRVKSVYLFVCIRYVVLLPYGKRRPFFLRISCTDVVRPRSAAEANSKNRTVR